MKKNLLLLCAVSLCISLAGCGEEETLNRPTQADMLETTTETTETTSDTTVSAEATTVKEQTTTTTIASETSTTTSQAVTSVSIVTQIVQQVQEQPTDPKETPTVSAQIQYMDSRDENGNYNEGYDYYADLSGNFDYCKICVKKVGSKKFESYPTPEATFLQGQSYLESASWIEWDRVEVIPYFFDGTVGNKITFAESDFVHKEKPHSSDSWRPLYAAQLNACYESSSDKMYSLFDVNSDGVPELFVSEGGYDSAGCELYAIVNGKCTYLDILGDYGVVGVSQTAHAICYTYSFWDSYAGGALQFDGQTLRKVDSYEYSFDEDGYGSYNGVEMSGSDVEYLVNTEYNAKYSNVKDVGRDNYLFSNMDASSLYYYP